MSEGGFIDIEWPKAGVDRSTSYNAQLNMTTPDAVNVRPEGSEEFRNRGGSRPGLGLALRTQLPATIRMLTKVSILKATWPSNYSFFGGTQLRDTLLNVPWQDPPTFTRASNFRGARLDGAEWGIGFPEFQQKVLSGAYEVTVHLAPGESYEGQVNVYLGLATPTTDPATDSIRVSLLLTNGTYQAEVQETVSSVPGAVTQGTVYDDNPNSPGLLTVRVTPNTKAIRVFWRDRLVLNYTAAVMDNHETAVEVDGGSITVVRFSTEFPVSTNSTTVYDDLRRDILVAASQGKVWMEDTADSLREVETELELNPDVDLNAVDREQLLFIADYGTSYTSDGAQIDGPDYNMLASDVTLGNIEEGYVLEIVDSDYSQNEKQVVTITSVDGGTFRFSYQGVYTIAVLWNSAASTIKGALQAIATIDEVDVTGDQANGWTIEFKGTHAGKDVNQLEVDISSLTSSTGGTPAVSVATIQTAAGGDLFLGQYEITGINGSEISFDPPLRVEEGFTDPIGAVKFQVVRSAKVFDPREETLVEYRATAGFVPGGSRIIELYRDRIVLAGGDLLPHVWYMSRQGDPFDWDYSQEDSAAAVAAQSSRAGQLAEPITALIAHGDECLIIGCYNSLWIVRGDPGYGGSLDQLSRKVGIVGPRAWCRTADDMCVFLSPDGLWVMPAGCSGVPTSLSRERMPDELLGINSTRQSVNLEFDTVYRGVHIFVTSRDGSEASHWWFDWETKSFWRVKLQGDHEPYSTHERIAWSDTPVVLVAGQDGYIRYFDRAFQVDDGDNEIEAYCDIGPFPLSENNHHEGVLTHIQGVLGVGSNPVIWEARSGNSAQEAYLAEPKKSGEWARQGLNGMRNPRLRGESALVRVKNKGKLRWFLERITVGMRYSARRRI